ncbi:MAG: methionine--tRNA ligase, partial [Spirochaetae bacterium HGW-Spirochaetae-6]
PIHIGHIAGAYLPADIYVHFNKLMGRDVLYICGTDEHGVPITIRAEQEGISPKDVVDRYHQEIKSSFDSLQIEFDNFSRTSLSEHYAISQGFFKELLANDYIETNVEKQLFCEDNQKFLPDRYIEGTCPHCGNERARGDECPKCGKWLEATELKNPSSKLCKSPLVIKETQHWYLRLDKLQGKLESWLEQKDWKDNVKNFVLGWFKDGLKPRPITRDLAWGIPVPLDLPEAKNKVLYVWFDAPIGYLSSTVEWAAKKGTPEAWKGYWQDPTTKLVHFIGKDNIPFHAIVWPAMLMGQTTEYILPSEIPANEHLTVEGEKISTSRGNAVWIPEFLEDFPSDYLRYYLAVNAPENKDADFSWKNFQNVINAELINIVANLFNRVLSFTFSRYAEQVPQFKETKANGYDEQILDQIKSTIRKAKKLYGEFRVRDVTREILDLARAGNQYFQDNEPWKMVKTDEERVAVVLNVCIRLIEALAILYYPIIPKSSQAMWEALNMPFPLENSRLEMIEDMSDPGGRPIRQPMPLFAKVEDLVVTKHL